MHIIPLVTDNKPSGISGREENDDRNYFMINLLESMELGWDRTRDTCGWNAVNTIINVLLQEANIFALKSCHLLISTAAYSRICMPLNFHHGNKHCKR